MLFKNAEILICILLKKMLNKFEVAWLFYKYSEFETLNIGKKKTYPTEIIIKLFLPSLSTNEMLQYWIRFSCRIYTKTHLNMLYLHHRILHSIWTYPVLRCIDTMQSPHLDNIRIKSTISHDIVERCRYWLNHHRFTNNTYQHV